MSPDGRMEAVYDSKGNLVTSPENQGTYNYGTDDFNHMIWDVFPYWIHGNCEDDPTPTYKRVLGPNTIPEKLPELPKGPSDREMERIIEQIIGKPIFPKF